jgi:hypothetical protein
LIRTTRAIRVRAGLRAMWHAEFLDSVKVLIEPDVQISCVRLSDRLLRQGRGEREKGGYPKGFQDRCWNAEMHGFFGLITGGTIGGY